MDVKQIENEIDLKINMLSGSPLYADDLRVDQIKLKDIVDFGYAKYSRYLNLLTITKDELIKEGETTPLSLFEIIINSGDQPLIKAFAEGLCFFLNESVEDYYVVEGYGIAFGVGNQENPISKVVTTDNFPDIVQILKYQNCLTSSSNNYIKVNPAANEKTRKVQERMEKARIALEKAKQSSSASESNIDFFDIISSVSTKSNTYNKQNVWDLTFYQLYDEYKRLEAIVGFETSVLALTQGAKIDLKHWSSKI
jgi:hypothetical protein